MKEVANTQYVACMNPTAGSFQITPRMQRHFVTLAVHMPMADTIRPVTPHLPRKHEDNHVNGVACESGASMIRSSITLLSPCYDSLISHSSCATT